MPAGRIPEMHEFLYRDRTHLAVYAMAMYGLAVEKLQDREKLAMIVQNIGQFLQQDDENQTAWLNLPQDNWWWCWYGSEYEAQAYYLKLLSRTDPKGEVARRLVKYLLNNRKHATYWNSTRDTAVWIEAFADFLKASGEAKPEMTVEVWYDGQLQKAVEITPATLFTFDNRFVLEGEAVKDGPHTVELEKKGTGPLYYNGYLTNFTLEDPITKAGLEVKVQRKYYLLEKADKTVKAAGSRGQAVDQKVEKYDAQELKDLAVLQSGDLVEIELEIASKNDYEYLVFEDMKPAGFEPVQTCQRLQRQRPGGLHGVSRQPGGLLRPQPGPRQPQRELPHAGRDSRQIQRPAGEGLGNVRPGVESELRRDQASGPRLNPPARKKALPCTFSRCFCAPSLDHLRPRPHRSIPRPG